MMTNTREIQPLAAGVPMVRSVSMDDDTLTGGLNKALSHRTETTAADLSSEFSYELSSSSLQPESVGRNGASPIGLRGSSEQEEEEPHLDWSFLKEGQLFGRDAEVTLLQNAFQRRLVQATEKNDNNQSPAFVLVSGQSGTGKTALVKSALKDLVAHQHRGYFLLGKFWQFDQLSTGATTQEPFGAFVAALNQLAVLLQEADSDWLLALRNKILSHVGTESCQAICALVPAFSSILKSNAGKEPVLNTNYDAKQDRLKVALTKLFQVLCSPAHPIALCLDDLQWADKESLDLLEGLASDTTVEGLMVLGICRSNEVSWHHEFASMLRRLEDEKDAKIEHIEVHNLDLDATNLLLAQILHQPAPSCQQLASILHQKSGGNVFFTMQLVRDLHEKGVIVAHRLPPPGEQQQDTHNQQLATTTTTPSFQWAWQDDLCDLADFQQEDLEVVNLVSNRIQSLPLLCRKLLKTAACIGAEFDLNVIVAISDSSSGTGVGNDHHLPSIPEMMSPALEERLLVRQSCSPGRYAFAHDRVQQASYAMISEEDRPKSHLGIGKKLLKQLDHPDFEDKLYLIVNQLLQGASLLKTDHDRTNLASLSLKAGKKAMQTCNFVAALSYFKNGISLLPNRHWRDEYHLSLDLFSSKAEAESSLAQFDDADSTVEEVLSNCRSTNDKARAYLIKIYSLGVQSDFQNAVDLGLTVMAESFGEKFPSKPGIRHLIPEILKLKRRLKSTTDEDIMNLPQIDPLDRGTIAAIQILKLLCVYVFCTDPALYPLLIIRWFKLTLKYGICDATPVGIGSLGCLLCALGNFDEAYRYARLSLRLLDERCNARSQMLPRVHLIVYGVVSHWKVPLRSTLDPLKRAITSALDSGDYECAIFTSYNVIVHTFASGCKLSLVDELLQQYLPLMERQEGPWLALAMAEKHMVDNLMGKSDNPLELNFQLSESTQSSYNFQLYKSACTLCRLTLSYHFGHYDVAFASAKASREVEKVLKTSIMYVYLYFYDGLTSLELAATKKGWKRRAYVARAKRIIRVVEKLAMAGPENILNKLYLLRGEMCAVKGDREGAMGWYQKAIDHAAEQGVALVEALAYERSSIALQRFGIRSGSDDETEIQRLNQEAISRYQVYDAFALVKQLQCKRQ